eukprot:643096-Amphidinium_carterae.1
MSDDFAHLILNDTPAGVHQRHPLSEAYLENRQLQSQTTAKVVAPRAHAMLQQYAHVGNC